MTDLKSSLVTALDEAAAKAGLTVVSAAQSSGSDGRPTTAFHLALPGGEAAHSL